MESTTDSQTVKRTGSAGEEAGTRIPGTDGCTGKQTASHRRRVRCQKEIAIIIASVVLFVILAALVVFERQNPEGGTVILQNLLGSAGK